MRASISIAIDDAMSAPASEAASATSISAATDDAYCARVPFLSTRALGHVGPPFLAAASVRASSPDDDAFMRAGVTSLT